MMDLATKISQAYETEHQLNRYVMERDKACTTMQCETTLSRG